MTLSQVLQFQDTLTNWFNSRHSQAASDSVFMTCLRSGVEFSQFLADVASGDAFDLEGFSTATEGNLESFVSPTYRSLVRPLINVTPGGNGGMASVGRGEFVVELLSNFTVQPSKEGRGDWRHPDRFEEVKFNGGKVGFSDKQGKEVDKTFRSLLAEAGVALRGKDWVPFRKADAKVYSNTELETLNGYYWQALSGDASASISDEELKVLFLSRSFDKVFSVTDSLIVFDETGDFVRFFSPEEALSYYSQRLDTVKLECRCRQSNPVTTYLFCETVFA